jgi:3-oxoacyl-[acyl-carrier protein] reductase
MALRFAADGLAIGVNYRTAAAEAGQVVEAITAAGGRAVPLQADVSDPARARALVESAENALGRLAVVVSNAGITRDRLLIQMSEEDWLATWDTDLSGPRGLCREAIERMGRSGGGRIITVSSVVAVTGNAGQANYASAKSALEGFTRQLAVEAAPRGVTVNCIIPGYIPTDATAHLTGVQKEAWFRRIPMARGGSASDIAELAAFLGVGDAGYITGQCIAVDGGLLARAGQGFGS